ncbi:nucleotide sugar dehydrogenase [Maribacter halichondriae]|uniref:nucleotide sugar dehydrogenase n=1 Tax=Maribacter halichondriae TaxID=2980554 RepID=UPI0023585CEA|nr:nucleotide sugar dehydrogenase [Maribacter sp. Hal144]
MAKIKIGIVGLGYVGLPLARLFATKYPVIGYDIDPSRIRTLRTGSDRTLEISEESLNKVLTHEPPVAAGLYPSENEEDLKGCNFFIVTVPTPVDETNKPDLTKLYRASETIGKFLEKGDIVVYESTVYPGATEEECAPILERESGLKLNTDFFIGYSPERMNPGDKEHTVDKILKVTSGSTVEAAKKIDTLYKSVVTAGTYLAPSIKVAEAAKVIENSQRDINIAFVNELSKIFHLMDIDTKDVLEAAATKWNFLPFKPGLVGGHCIGVDPYYLAQKAQEYGYHPEIILAGRRMNDGMGKYVASQIVKLMVKNDIPIKESEILILGITFKENCPDVRNTKVVDMISELKSYDANITVYDPWASPGAVFVEHGLDSSNLAPENKKFDAIVLAVAHNEFLEFDLDRYLKKESVVYDIKGILKKANGGL